MKIHKEISEKKLKEEMQKFIGKIMQLPPVKSRVKREIREREVYSWEILEFDIENKEVLFECEVEAGTYIRKICSDLGLKIGGAHMIELRRTKAGIFEETDSINLYELEKIKNNEQELRKKIIPGEIIIKLLPIVQVKDDEKIIKQLLTGKPIFKKDLAGELKIKDNEDFCVFSGDKFTGVYKKVSEGDIIGRAEFVFN